MINIGDTVKIIGKTACGGYEEVECIPIGTICRVTNIEDKEKEKIIGVEPINDYPYEYWYLEKDLEKGHMEWIKEEMVNMNVLDEYFYELCYFHSRKDSGSLYVKSDKGLKDFLGEDEFLDYLMKNKKITYSDAQSIVEIIEITEMEYEDFK